MYTQGGKNDDHLLQIKLWLKELDLFFRFPLVVGDFEEFCELGDQKVDQKTDKY
jgi:hypothetical protein